MTDIVISEFMDSESVAELTANYQVSYNQALVDNLPELYTQLADARALIIRNRTQVDTKLLDAGPALQVIGRLGVGLDNVDLAACKARGIEVCPATGANDDSVAEYVLTSVLILLRGAYGAAPAMRAGQWPRQAMIGREAAGQALGLVGFGSIGRRVAILATGLGMTVHAFDPGLAGDDPVWTTVTRHDELASLLAGSDAVSLHVPLLDSTRHLMDAGALAAMKPGAVLINAARGGVVDEAALVGALRSGHLGGAALDVYEREPMDAEAGGMFEGLDNIILTPHIAGLTEQSQRRVGAVTVRNVRRVLD